MRLPVPADDERCPCCSGAQWGACCGPYLAGERDAPTPEALMRSRFSAFAVGDASYLHRSWAPTTRPRTVDLDPEIDWRQLTIFSAKGGPFDDAGEVDFLAQYRAADGRDRRLHELSRFAKVRGRWVYVDGTILR